MGKNNCKYYIDPMLSKILLICWIALDLIIGTQALATNEDIVLNYISNSPTSYIAAAGSQAGGQQLYISGLNFGTNLLAITVSIGPYPCIPNFCNNFFIGCITTQATNIPKFQLNLPLSVTVRSKNGALCSTSQCQYQYKSTSTPVLVELFPTSVAAGDVLNVIGYHLVTAIGNGFAGIPSEFNYLLLGLSNCGLYNVKQMSISTSQMSSLACRVDQNLQAGQYNFTENIIYGNANISVRNYMTSLFTLNTYMVRVINRIQSLPFQKGGLLGHLLTISANNLISNLSNYTCHFESTQCDVVDVSDSHLTIRVPPYNPQADPLNFRLNKQLNDTSNQTGAFVGSYGFYYTRYSHNCLSCTVADMYKIMTNQSSPPWTVLEQRIVTELGTGQIYNYPYFQYYRGYIHIPVDGQYRFELSCDDGCMLQQSSFANNSNSHNLQTLLTIINYSPSILNNYNQINKQNFYQAYYKSGYYYTAVYALNKQLTGFLKVSLQTPAISAIFTSDLASNRSYPTPANPTYKIQTFNITPTATAPEIIKTVVNITSLQLQNMTYYTLYLQTGSSPNYVILSSSPVYYLSSSKQLLDAINKIGIIARYSPTVTLNTYDKNHVLTTNLSKAIFYEYLITFAHTRHPIDNFPILVNVSQGIKIFTAQAHSPYLSGSYSIMVNNSLLTVGPSTNISTPFSSAAASLATALNSFYNSSEIVVDQVVGTNYYDEEVITILYKGIADPLPISIDITKLAGGISSSVTVQLVANRNYSAELPFFEKFPLELMRTAEDEPSIIIKVNKLPIICENCHYSYSAELTPTVYFMQNNGSFLTLGVINNYSNITVEMSDVSVSVGAANCLIISGSLANFTCLMDNIDSIPLIEAGLNIPTIHITKLGFASTSNISKFFTPLTVSQLTPSSSTIFGNINCILTGRGFPVNTSKIQISICGNSVDQYISTNSTVIEFVVPPSNLTDCPKHSFITVNNETTYFNFSYLQPSSLLQNVSPTHLNPFLPAILSLTGFSLDNSTLVQLANRQNGLRYHLPFKSVNQSQIQCQWNGGQPGDYVLEIAFENNMLLATDTTITVGILISQIYPLSGSLGGGYQLSIIGNGFLHTNQTTVIIGIQSSCMITFINYTLIQCSVSPISSFDSANQNLTVVVITRGIVTSSCDFCLFSYCNNDTIFAPLQTNSSFSAGSIITLNMSLVEPIQLWIEDNAYPFNVSFGTISFSYPPLPNGYHKISIMSNGSLVYPSILTYCVQTFSNSLSFNSGSAAGRLLNITGNGLDSQIDNNLMKIWLTCGLNSTLVRMVHISSNMITAILPPKGSQTCSINYYQGTLRKSYSYSYSYTSTPAISIAYLANYSYRINKLNLTQISYDTAYLSLLLPGGIEAALNYSMNITNMTGVSFVISPSQGYLPAGGFHLYLHHPTYGFASIANSQICIEQPFLSALEATPQSSSFAGGGQYMISGAGFIVDQIHLNKIKVCGYPSQILSANTTNIVIRIPPLITSTTNSMYNLGKPENLTGTWFADTPLNIQYVNRKDISTAYTSANISCFIGIDLGADLQANINKITFFPNKSWPNAAKYLFGAVFQGSNDNLNWSLIYQVDTSLVHLGHNFWVNQDNTSPSFRYIRFRHNQTSMCQLEQLHFQGLVNHPDKGLEDYICNVTVETFNSSYLIGQITYSLNKTSIINKISPQYGTIEGNTLLFIKGSNFSKDVTVMIDDIQCIIVNSTQSYIYCLTGPRMSYNQPNYFVVYSGESTAILMTEPFLYISKWSDFSSWAGQVPPVDLENVVIHKGTNLYIDTDTPRLGAISSKGGRIIISDEQDIKLTCKSINIQQGSLVVGSHISFYTHNFLIQLWGASQNDKKIACDNCQFHIFGRPNNKTWVQLSKTIQQGDITLQLSENVDWLIGQTIVVTSTNFDYTQSQVKTIVSIFNKSITVDSPFAFHHFGEIEDYGNQSLNMRSEVGLLSRNIQIVNQESSNQGSSLTFVGNKRGGLSIYMRSVQMTECGASFQGLSCINLNILGEMDGSSIQKIVAYNTYSRMMTIQNTHFLRVEGCVGYNISGNGITLLEGSETNNNITNNLIISTRNNNNYPLLDLSSSAYLISHPYNIISNNRAAGGDFFGFHFLFPVISVGSSMVLDLCPRGSKVLFIDNNVAHSFGLYGFRVVSLVGRKFPCLKIQNQSNINPYIDNPSVHSQMNNLFAFKNSKVGFLGEDLGNFRLSIKVSDSNYAGVQIYKTNFTLENVVISDSMIVGFSTSNSQASTLQNNPSGLMLSRTDGLSINSVQFANFNSSMSAISSCSECNNSLYLVVGGRSTSFSGMTFTNVANYVSWNYPRRQIFIDLDGTLTNQIQTHFNITLSSATISPFRPSLLLNTSCLDTTVLASWDGSVLCFQEITVRSILFTNINDYSSFQYSSIKAYLLGNPMENLSTLTNSSLFGVEPIFQSLPSNDISYSWAMPFITNQYYNIHWDLGVDFIHLQIGANLMWTENDSVVLRFNSSIFRQAYVIGKYFTQQLLSEFDLESQELILPQNCSNGEFYNDKSNQYLFLCVSGRNKNMREWLDVSALSCYNLCPFMIKSGMETNLRFWSDASNWPNKTLPQLGQNVTIPSTWNMLLDIDPPELYFVEINGNLIFDRNRNNTFTAHIIFVNEGTIWIGTSLIPFVNNANIILKGNSSDPLWTLNNRISGKKMLLVLGGLQLHGKAKSNAWQHIIAPAYANSAIIIVNSAVDWQEGDQLAISSSYREDQTEIVTIMSVNGTHVRIDPPLRYDHYGASSATTGNSYGSIDTRSVAAVITRNIKITGSSDKNSGARVIIASDLKKAVDSPILQSVVASGYANLVNIEISNAGDNNNKVAAINFIDLSAYQFNLNASTIQGSSVHHCNYSCISAHTSSNITISSSVFALSNWALAHFTRTNYYNFSQNLMLGLQNSSESPLSAMFIHNYPFFALSNVKISNNIAIGSTSIGYYFPFISCSNTAIQIINNLAGFCKIAYYIFGDALASCLKMSALNAYSCRIGLYSTVETVNYKVILSNLYFTDNWLSLHSTLSAFDFNNMYIISNSYFRGVASTSTLNCLDCAFNFNSQCSGSYLMDVPRSSSPLDVSRLNLNNMNTYMPSFGNIFLSNSLIQNYNSQMISNCTDVKLFRLSNDSFFSLVSLHIKNVSFVNCPQVDWVELQMNINAKQAFSSLILDLDGSLTGNPTSLMPANFWTYQFNCQPISLTPIILCPINAFNVLLFESIAPDFLNRILSPISFTDLTSKTTILNLVEKITTTVSNVPYVFNKFSCVLSVNNSFEINYAGFPPIDSLYQLQQGHFSATLEWLLLKITFSPLDYLSVYVTNQSGTDAYVPPIALNQSITLLTSQCGSNFYSATQGSIQFILNNVNGCQVRIIQGSFMSVNAVIDCSYSNLNATQMIYAFASQLGISSSRIRLIDIQSGSVQATIYVPANITARGNSYGGTNPSNEIAQFQSMGEKLQQLSLNDSFVGNQLLSLSYSYVIVRVSQEQPESTQSTSFPTGVLAGILLAVIGLFILCLGYLFMIRYRKNIYAIEVSDVEEIQNKTEFEQSNLPYASISPLQI